MKVIRGLNQIKKFRKSVVAIGVFDGVHRGHKTILEQAVKKAKEINGTSLVLTFWPHPQKKALIYSLLHRLRLIAELGIAVSAVINFNKKFAAISADDFIRDILYKKIRPAYLYIGRNFHFGRKGKGDVRTLRAAAKKFGFGVGVFPTAKVNGRNVSSTYIRNLIKRGRLSAAANLLGRRVSVLGTVIKGQARGAQLGYPTANIDAHHEVVPPSGVYAVRVIFTGRGFNGICNIGSKPTFSNTGERHIEVYIFNFKRNIYGRDLELQFIKKIRQEKKFSTPQALSLQIRKDILSAF